MAGPAHQRAGVQDQCDATDAHDRGAGYFLHLAIVGFQVLNHHHLLLAEQFVDEQGDTRTFQSGCS
jgi:hypothetical protein